MTPAPHRRLLRLAAVLVLAVPAALVPSTAAVAADQLPPPRSQLRICDPTACYVAWHVIDSDRDGVSDADELAAGTNPYDPTSYPPLTFVAELGLTRQLPSFENGLGTFVVFPPEIVAASKQGSDPFGAFPLHDRADALTRMGISNEQLTKFGISADSSGFSIGLDSVGGKDDRPGLRVGGIAASLISAGIDPPTSFTGHGGIIKAGRNQFGNDIAIYRDGFWTEGHTNKDGGYTMQKYNSDDSPSGSRTIEGGPNVEADGTRSSSETVTDRDNDGNILEQTTTEKHTYADGSTSEISVSYIPVRDESGKVIGQTKVTTFKITNGDGSYGMGVKQTEQCDAGGKNCVQTAPEEYEDTDTVDADGDGVPDWKQKPKDDTYANPDADNDTLITEEMVDGALRVRGAAVKVVQGWSAPDSDGDPQNPRDPTTVALIDSDQQALYLLVEPLRVTTAQPEGRPDLPNPGVAAPPPSGACTFCG